jgi:hypothetical protein
MNLVADFKAVDCSVAVKRLATRRRTMNGVQEKITFDTNKCRTQRTGAIDLFDCLAEKQYLICSYALPFGYGRFCKHTQRREFAKKLSPDKPVNPSQSETLE